MLPFAELNNVFEALDLQAPTASVGWDHGPNRTVYENARVPLLFCPSSTLDMRSSPQGGSGIGHKSHYFGISGAMTFGTFTDTSQLWPSQSWGASSGRGMLTNRRSDGDRSRLGQQISACSDGTSKTLAMMEMLQPPQNHSSQTTDRRGRVWNDDSGCYQISTRLTPNSLSPDYGSCIDDPAKGWPCTRDATASNATQWFMASRSRHPGGVHAVFCDGSVSLVVDSIDLAVWAAASGQGDGEAVTGVN
jgi:prepilin-type processing-associated H-X9-DG protein